MAGLALQQKPRNDARDPAAALEGGVGEQTHQADATAAIDQCYALTGQKLAQPDGNIAGRRIGAKTGAAEDAQGRGGGNGHGGFFFTNDPMSFRTGTAWYHFAEGGRDAKGLVVAPSGG